MAETFHTLIAKNKRNSMLLILLFMVFFIGLGLLIGVAWGGGYQRTGSEAGYGYDSNYVSYTADGQPSQQAAGEWDPNWPFAITVACIAGAVAFFMTLGSYFGGSKVLLAMSGAHEIKKSDDPQLFNVVEELSIAAGVPIPRIFVINTQALNAFATGRNPKNAAVAITLGLRQKLNRDELQGVMAHEMSHVRHYDILYATLMAVMVGCVVLLADVFLRSMFWRSMGGRRRDNDNGGGNPIQLIIMIVAIVFAILSPILAKIIQMSLSRQREYLADAGAVELTRNPAGLTGALEKLGGDHTPMEQANRATAPMYIVNPVMQATSKEEKGSLFDTHPPISKRVARLRQLSL